MGDGRRIRLRRIVENASSTILFLGYYELRKIFATASFPRVYEKGNDKILGLTRDNTFDINVNIILTIVKRAVLYKRTTTVT